MKIFIMRITLFGLIFFTFFSINAISVSAAETTVSIEVLGETFDVYVVPGTGEYEGWEQFKGFKGENLLDVYFYCHPLNEYGTFNISYKSNYIGSYDFSKRINWVDGLGLIHTGTLGQMFDICTGNDTSMRKLEAEFGQVYDEWFELNTIRYADYIDDYLIGVGRMEEKLSPIDKYSVSPEEWKLIPPSEEEIIQAAINDVRYKAIDTYNQLLVDSSGYYAEDWISEDALSPYGVSCVSSLDSANTWEFWKDSKLVHTLRLTGEQYKNAQDKTVIVNGIRLQIDGRYLSFNVQDLIAKGLFDSEMFLYIPDYDSFINDAVRLFLEENYPDINSNNYLGR